MEALNEHCSRLRTLLGAGAEVSADPLGESMRINISYVGDPAEVTIRIDGHDTLSVRTVDNGAGLKVGKLTFDFPTPTVLVNVGRAIRMGDAERFFTAINRPSRGMLHFLTYNSGAMDGFSVVLEPKLALEYDDKSSLELTPDSPSQEDPAVDLAGAYTFPRGAVVRASAVGLVSKEPLNPPPEHRGKFIFDRALPLELIYRVTSGHWAYAIRYLVIYSNAENDGRNWDFSHLATLRRGEIAAVDWRVDGTMSTGDLVSNAAALRGAAVGVRDGKLSLFEIRNPTTTEATVASISADDFRPETQATFEQVEDGLITSVTVLSTRGEIQVVDTVARERFGAGRPDVKISATGAAAAMVRNADPVTTALTVGLPYLQQWGVPVFTVKLPVTAKFAHVQLGDFVTASVFNAPDGKGGRGMSAKPLLVIGKSENLANGEIELECLYFQASTAWAPCVRVKSISGAVVTVENDTYVSGAINDYTGSLQPSYRFHVAAFVDGGTSFFQPGFGVELIQRDVETMVTEAFEVVAVSAVPATFGLSTITLDRAIPAEWATRAIVDLRFGEFPQATNEQRKYAFSNNQATRIIADTEEAAKNWGT